MINSLWEIYSFARIRGRFSQSDVTRAFYAPGIPNNVADVAERAREFYNARVLVEGKSSRRSPPQIKIYTL